MSVTPDGLAQRCSTPGLPKSWLWWVGLLDPSHEQLCGLAVFEGRKFPNARLGNATVFGNTCHRRGSAFVDLWSVVHRVPNIGSVHLDQEYSCKFFPSMLP